MPEKKKKSQRASRICHRTDKNWAEYNLTECTKRRAEWSWRTSKVVRISPSAIPSPLKETLLRRRTIIPTCYFLRVFPSYRDITGAITFRSVPQLCLLRLSLSREIPTIVIDYSRRPTVWRSSPITPRGEYFRPVSRNCRHDATNISEATQRCFLLSNLLSLSLSINKFVNSIGLLRY